MLKFEIQIHWLILLLKGSLTRGLQQNNHEHGCAIDVFIFLVVYHAYNAHIPRYKDVNKDISIYNKTGKAKFVDPYYTW